MFVAYTVYRGTYSKTTQLILTKNLGIVFKATEKIFESSLNHVKKLNKVVNIIRDR